MQYITKKVYDSILNTIGKSPIESGGILGEKDGIICEFYFDEDAKHTKSNYIPNLSKLNKVIEEWQENGVQFIGFAHSHPNEYNKPSLGDGLYAQKLLTCNPQLERLIFPIVIISLNNVQVFFYEFVNEFKPINVYVIGENK